MFLMLWWAHYLLYHNTDDHTGLTVGKHPLVLNAQKYFWQLRPLLPEYCGTYDVKLVPRLIENLDERKL